MLWRESLPFGRKRVRREWNNIEVKSYNKVDSTKAEMTIGADYIAELELFIGELDPKEVGVEILIAEQDNTNRMHIRKSFDFELISFDSGTAKYRCVIQPDTAGVFNMAGRIYPKILCCLIARILI